MKSIEKLERSTVHRHVGHRLQWSMKTKISINEALIPLNPNLVFVCLKIHRNSLDLGFILWDFLFVVCVWVFLFCVYGIESPSRVIVFWFFVCRFFFKGLGVGVFFCVCRRSSKGVRGVSGSFL